MDNLAESFLSINNIDELAKILDIKSNNLYYYAFRANQEDLYTSFNIPKKDGSLREINAPIKRLKVIQQRLSNILNYVYKPKKSAHGYVRNKSIKTNAEAHFYQNKPRKLILNIDLEDFFPSITYQRIVGLFLSRPYSLPEEIAHIIARLTCFQGKLPQGSPTSPILSNMICRRLDHQLIELAKKSRCIYTRYADDITFSTSFYEFPKNIITDQANEKLELLGDELKSIIKSNGFIINEEKIRL